MCLHGVCRWACVCPGVCVKVRGQFCAGGSPFPPSCGFWGLNSAHQAWMASYSYAWLYLFMYQYRATIPIPTETEQSRDYPSHHICRCLFKMYIGVHRWDYVSPCICMGTPPFIFQSSKDWGFVFASCHLSLDTKQSVDDFKPLTLCHLSVWCSVFLPDGLYCRSVNCLRVLPSQDLCLSPGMSTAPSSFCLAL